MVQTVATNINRDAQTARRPKPTYPADRKHIKVFALKFLHQLLDSGASQELGQAATVLVTVVVMGEDTKRYSNPVSYWHDQILKLCGFSEKTFRTARRRAVKEGWLAYVKGSKHRAARYWVTIPANLKRENLPLEGQLTGSRGAVEGQTFIPNPKPLPSPKEKKQKKTPSSSFSADVVDVFDHYKARHPTSKLGSTIASKITARLKDGFSVQQLKDAIDGRHRSQWYVENGVTKLTQIFKDSDTVTSEIERLTRPAKSEKDKTTLEKTLEGSKEFLEGMFENENHRESELRQSNDGAVRRIR